MTKLSQFLVNAEDTGRFKVISQRTGRTYLVETIDGRNRPPVWGDVNPASGEVEGTYGAKFKGSIKECDSIIEKNKESFKEIHDLKEGVSPLGFIEQLDSKYPDKPWMDMKEAEFHQKFYKDLEDKLGFSHFGVVK